MFIYLGGSLTYLYKNNLSHLAIDWRNNLAKFCDDNDIKYFNPVKTFEIEENHSYNPKLCVDQNRFYLNKADILIMDFSNINHSPGSLWELFYALEVRHIPVIAYNLDVLSLTWAQSSHISYGISHSCNYIDEVKEVLINMFGQSFKNNQ